MPFRFLGSRKTVEVHPATQADARNMAAIHREGFSRGWTDGEIEGLMSRDTTFALKAVAGGIKPSLLGFVLVVEAAGEGEILTIAVARSARGQGIGEKLMRAAFARLAANRAESLFLEVEEGNAPAIALYRKLGFRQVGRREAYYRGTTEAGGAALVMRRDL